MSGKASQWRQVDTQEHKKSARQIRMLFVVHCFGSGDESFHPAARITSTFYGLLAVPGAPAGATPCRIRKFLT